MEARSAREESTQTVLQEILSHGLCNFSVHIARADVGEQTYRNVAETATEASLETHLGGDGSSYWLAFFESVQILNAINYNKDIV